MENEKNEVLQNKKIGSIESSELNKVSGGAVYRHVSFGYDDKDQRIDDRWYKIAHDDDGTGYGLYERFDDFESASKADMSRGGNGKLIGEIVIGYNKF